MIFSFLKKYKNNKDGLAAVEVSLILPVLLTLLLGMVDLGHGLMVKKKVIGASQIIGDLLTRTSSVTQDEIDDAILAGKLALAPYPDANYGVDIVSIEFVGDEAVPTELWRETYNRTPNTELINYVDTLGDKGDGTFVVAVSYEFEPFFTGFILDYFTIEEVAFSRGRRSAVVRRE